LSHQQAIEGVAMVPRQCANAQRGGQTNFGKLEASSAQHFSIRSVEPVLEGWVS
jgi:hypothetical protein